MAGEDIAQALKDVVTRGREAFAYFDDRSNFVVGIAHDPDAVRQAVASLPDGHRIVAGLADDPDQAAEILSQRGAKLGAALGRFAGRLDARPPVQPKPAAKPEVVDPEEPGNDMPQYVAAREEQARQKRERKAASSDIFNPKMPMTDYVLVRNEQDRQRLAAKRAR